MSAVDAFFAGIALAFVVVVWAMNPKVGAHLKTRHPLGQSAGCTDAQHPEGR